MRPALVPVLLAAAMAAALSPAAAQGPGPGVAVRFERLGLDEGLSQASVVTILQDRRGFLWFGTQDGLNRWDGARMRVLRHDPTRPGGLPTSYVQSLAESADGALWVATWGGGLARLDPETERLTTFRHDPDDAASLPDDIVTAVHEDRAGRLWVGTAAGLAWLDRRTGAFRRYAERVLPDPFVWSLAEGPGGELWVGTFRAGALRVDPATGRWRRYRHDPADPASLAADENALVRVTAAGEVWVGTNAGLHRLRAGGGFDRFAPDPADPASLCGEHVYDLRAARDGSLWVGTGDGGLCRRAAGADGFTAYRHNAADPTSLPKDVVRALWEDRAGTLWVGTDGGGAAAYTGASERMGLRVPDPLDAATLPHPYVWALHQGRDGAVWAGTDGGGLGRLDPATGRFETFRHRRGDPASLAADIVVSLEEGRDGTIWAGTFSAGLDRLDPATGRAAHFPEDPAGVAGPASATVTALHEAADGGLWVGTWDGGLSRLDPATGRFETERHDPTDGASLPHDVVTALRPARDGGLWVGTYGAGLAYRDARTGAYRAWSGGPGEPLSHATVYGLHEAPDGTVWVATAGGGLNELDPASGRVRVWTTRDGLPHNIVYGILPEGAPGAPAGGALWLSTNRGLARLDPATGAVRAVGAAQGAQGPEFNSGAAFRAADGSLLFGGTNGFNWFDPDALADAAPPPEVVLTGLRRFDEPVAFASAPAALDGVAFSHRDNFITVEFAAPGAPDPAATRYRYRLDGVDPGWRETAGPAPSASYTDLPAGTYAFRVRAAGPDGAWGPDRVLGVRVVPPWWATWWARLGALALALGALAAGAGAWRRRRAERARRAAAEEAEGLRRLAEGREAERLRLARELHDGPLQDLYGARFRLDALGEALGGDGRADLARAQATAEAAEQTILDVSRQLRAVCTELRPPVLGAMGVARALGAEAERLAAAHPQTALALDLAADGRALPETARIAAFRIGQEAVRNALRHGAPSRLSVRTADADGAFVVTVEDDGAGFAVPPRLAALARDGHLGLAGASERAAGAGGRLAVASAPGRGTRVTATFPHAPPAAP